MGTNNTISLLIYLYKQLKNNIICGIANGSLINPRNVGICEANVNM